MNEDTPINDSVPQVAEGFGNLPNNSELFRPIPNSAESFGTVPNTAEAAARPQHFVERKANHTLTVREVARMFEAAGVARTERSITNWCQASRTGIARLDSYFDPNERKYFITPESVNLAIQEEQSKAARSGDEMPPVKPVRNPSERPPQPEQPAGEQATGDMDGMSQEILDLMITNRAKDIHIKQLYKERDDFASERQGYVEKLMTFSRKVGELETRLLQLSAPRGNFPNAAEMAFRQDAAVKAESASLVSPPDQVAN